MIINYPETAEDNKTIFDVEEEGRVSLALIAARYVGPKSSQQVTEYRLNAGWPGGSPFQAHNSGDGLEPGPAQGALIAEWLDPDVEDDRTVEYLENDPDIEVFYRAEDIAKEMLQSNYLDPKVFGQGFDPDLRQRVFDALGLEDVGVRNESEYRRQLREVAGVELDADAERAAARDSQRVTEYKREHPRGELVSAAAILGYGDDPETDGKPESEGRINLAKWLADQEPEAVRFAFEGKAQAARDANDPSAEPDEADEPLTVADVVDTYDPEEVKDVVKAVREGTGEFSLRGKTTEDMAEFLIETKDLTEDQIDAHLMG